MLILDVGAYCVTQHMEFLNVPPAAEALVAATGSSYLVTARGNDLDKWRNVLPEKQELKVISHDANGDRTGRQMVSRLAQAVAQ